MENIAVNAVMAGCRPQYMPVLIAAQQAGFSLLLEERLPTAETPPPRLLRVYQREVLETEEVRLLLT